LFYGIRCLINVKPYKSQIPLLCIGNLTAGGAGKTPMAIEIAKILRNSGRTYCFLNKGYGGNFKGVSKLTANNRNANIVGDEALLLCEYGDTFVSRSRVRGLKYINQHYKYDYILLDDGLQNPTFVKNKIILMIYGEFGFGNGLLLPAGPLRETFSRAVSRHIDLTVIVGKDSYGIRSLCDRYSVMNIGGTIELSEPAEKYSNGPYVAFCGIANPEKFRKTLTDQGIDFVKFIAFADHHRYTYEDLKFLRKFGYTLITTKKDWVKINDMNIGKKDIDVVEISLQLEKVHILKNLLLG
jgi:tetraacyldisaccharide 4'-kinase